MRTKLGRVEFVSRVLPSNHIWQKQIDLVFDFLHERCYVQRTHGCSMHIHVSPSAEPKGQEDRWTTQNLNGIMKALSYFDDPITRIMPEERKNNPFAMSNLLSDECFKGNPKLRTMYQQIQVKTWKPLFDYFDTVMKSNLHKRQAHTIMGGSRYASWNFEHITDACGTVEFRRCPAVDRSSQAKIWVSFALGFLYAAAFLPPDWSNLAATKVHPPVTELDSFTRTGLRGLEATCQGAFRTLQENTNPAHLYSAAEMTKLLAKKKLLESCPNPDSYVQKVRLWDKNIGDLYRQKRAHANISCQHPVHQNSRRNPRYLTQGFTPVHADKLSKKVMRGNGDAR